MTKRPKAKSNKSPPIRSKITPSQMNLARWGYKWDGLGWDGMISRWGGVLTIYHQSQTELNCDKNLPQTSLNFSLTQVG